MSKGNEPKLMQIAERIVKLNKEKAQTDEILKEVYSEARNVGFEPKILKRAIRIMEMNEADRNKMRAEDEVLGLYLNQLDLGF